MEIEINKRFYIGSNDVAKAVSKYPQRDPRGITTVATIEEAIQMARERLLRDSGLEAVTVVQIVKLVRREPPPVVVLDVVQGAGAIQPRTGDADGQEIEDSEENLDQ